MTIPTIGKQWEFRPPAHMITLFYHVPLFHHSHVDNAKISHHFHQLLMNWWFRSMVKTYDGIPCKKD